MGAVPPLFAQHEVLLPHEPLPPAGLLLAQVAEQKATFERDGFMVLKSVVSSDLLQAARRHLDEVLWAPDRSQRPPLTLTVTSPGVYSGNVTMALRRALLRFRARTYRISSVHMLPDPSPWYRLVHDPNIMAVAQQLTGGVPDTIRSLLF